MDAVLIQPGLSCCSWFNAIKACMLSLVYKCNTARFVSGVMSNNNWLKPWKAALYFSVWVCLQDVDPCFPIRGLWNSGDLRNAQTFKVSLAQFSVWWRNKACVSHSYSRSEYITQKYNCWVTCPWKHDQNRWDVCSDETWSCNVQTVNCGLCLCVGVCLYESEWGRMLAPFQKKKTGFCLGADAQRRGSRECGCEG